MNRQIRGVIPAILTSLTDDREPDLQMLAKQTEYLASSGVHGFFIGGTTAEGAFLSTEQKRMIFKTVKEVSAGRQFLCLAALQPSTPQVVKEIHRMEDLEPDYFVAVTPFYGVKDQETIKGHYTVLARESPVPLILYNIPGRTQSPMTVETVLQLSRVENITGIKDSSGDFMFFTQGFLGEYPKDFTWIIGEDLLNASALLLGIRCIVTGLGNVRIEHYIDMFTAAEQGDAERVKENQRILNLYRSIFSVCPSTKTNAAVKAGTAYYGRSGRRMIMPAMELTDQECARVETILSGIDGR